MKKKHQIYLTSFLTIAAIIGINKLTSVSCSEMNVFKGDSLYSIVKFLKNAFLGIGIWIIGYQISKKINLEKNTLIAYFIILSLISTSGTLKKIWKSNFSKSSELIKAICEKSKDDGMVYEAYNLTSKEYNYLIRGSGWLPKSPPKAKNIEINYYRDDFLGDYSLGIEIEFPENEKFDYSKYPKWREIEDNKYEFAGYQN